MERLSRRYGPWSIALPALVGACAAMVTPGAGGTTGAGATCLAVGALALLAGHTWGLLVLVPAHVVLVGRLWPAVALPAAGAAEAGSTAAIAVVLVTALPTLALSAVALPAIIAHILPDRTARGRSFLVAAGALALAAALIVPAVVESSRRSVHDRGVASVEGRGSRVDGYSVPVGNVVLEGRGSPDPLRPSTLDP
jgi:hypothetical protein